ncbi:hypothetical protein MZE11_19440, partial [Bacillus amyloliquefaciens]|uniref:hypothetical protein n=1 Tax=Bacillus amyloliquefaciens TaxID=1390 RepID=UPI00211A086B
MELDPDMLQTAQNHFELQLDERLLVQIKDGLDFLKEEAAADAHYDAIMFDMDSKDRNMGLSCPPAPFLEEDILQDINKILHN